IPRYSNPNRVAASAPKTAAPAATPAPANPGVHVVALGETLTKISRLYGKSVADIAKANNIQANARLNVGDRLVIPGVRTSASQAPAIVADASGRTPVPKEPEITPSASMFTPVAESPAASDPLKTADGTGSLPKFRWPANGRVVASFGPTTNGGQNDGINI